MELPFLKNNSVQKVPVLVMVVTAVTTLIILYLGPIYYPSTRYPASILIKPPSDHQSAATAKEALPYRVVEEKLIKLADKVEEKCDIFVGEWVPNPDAPYYTNTTCWAIHEHQNCMKYGRPDDGFMKWRWKPHGCELPIFNPYQFLNMMKGKSMAFVGDSVGRNHMQSLICLLSRVEFPVDDSGTDEDVDDYFRRWKYPSYNFTVAPFWTTFLVKSQQAEDRDLFNIYLDEFDEKWTSKIQEFDYVVINTGQWFFRPNIYYEKNQVVGCHACKMPNITELPVVYAYRRAWRTAFKAINGMNRKKETVVFLRTYAPSHFEGGDWNKGGNCLRKKPFLSKETTLDGLNLEIYLTQLVEFRNAKREGKINERLKFRWLDITGAMLLRPDGHPSRYGHLPNANVTLYNDCVHWCLPGPVDSWNDFLLHMLKMEGRRSHEEQLQPPTKGRR